MRREAEELGSQVSQASIGQQELLFSFPADEREWGALVYAVLGEENSEPRPSLCIREVYAHRLSGHVYISHLAA